MTATMSRTTDPHTPQAPDQPPRRPPVGNWPWLISAAITMAVIFSSFSLNGVLLGWGWLPQVVVTVAAVTAAAAWARILRVPAGLIPVAGIVVLIAVVTLLFFPDESFIGFIPTTETLDALWIALQDANQVVVNQVAPVQITDGIVLVTCVGLGLVALLLDTLTASLQMPATSGLGILAVLVVPAIVKSSSVGIAGYTAAIVGYLILLGTAHWIFSRADSSSGGYSASQLDRALVIGSAALAATLVLPLAVPGFTNGLFPEGSRLSLGTSSGLNPMVTLGNDLRNPGSVGRMTYTTTSEEPVYLRAVTLEHFDGGTWEPDQREGLRETGIDSIASETEELLQGPTEFATTRIDTGNFVSRWLPVPYAPVSVDGLSGEWSVDPVTLSILGVDQTTTAEQSYTVTSATPVLTKETLAGASAIPSDSLSEPFLDLPDELPQVIEQTVANVTEGITNRYRKAMAIQNHLRSKQFVYSETAPVRGGYDGSSMEIVARFLEEKSGYCVHYSAAMAVMARAEGIPSRIAVGYAPGTATGETIINEDGEEVPQFEVDSDDAHAWPELYFAGLGWVKFEPTPSRGVVPDYARTPSQTPDSGLNPNDLNPENLQDAAEDEDPSTDNDPSAGSRGSGPANDDGPSWIISTLVLIAALAAGAAPYLIRRRLTGSRLHAVRKHAGGSAAAAWQELNDTAIDYRVGAHESETPRRFTSRLSGSTLLSSSDDASAALHRLTLAYEQAEYGRPVAAGSSGQTAQTAPAAPPPPATAVAAEDLVLVQDAMSRNSTWQQRLVALLLPKSLVHPWRSTLN